MRLSALSAALLAAALAWPAAVAQAQPARVVLAPHRAVYDLSLMRSAGTKGVESIQGRIAFTFSGDNCEGFTLDFRQVTVLNTAETGSRTSDLRTTTFEDADGRTFRFKSESRQGSGAATEVDGVARKEDGGWTVALTKPTRDRLTLAPETLLPSFHMRRVIEAARAGERILNVPVFDGSDDGRKVYDTFTVIGAPIAAEPSEAPARQEGMKGLTRWPVTISYFAPGSGERTPAYKLVFELYENGVSGALRLDYGDFVVQGELKQLDMLDRSRCDR